MNLVLRNPALGGGHLALLTPVGGGIETGILYITSLDEFAPNDSDARSTCDDHLRVIKRAIRNTLPHAGGVVSLSASEINAVDGWNPALGTFAQQVAAIAQGGSASVLYALHASYATSAGFAPSAGAVLDAGSAGHAANVGQAAVIGATVIRGGASKAQMQTLGSTSILRDASLSVALDPSSIYLLRVSVDLLTPIVGGAPGTTSIRLTGTGLAQGTTQFVSTNDGSVVSFTDTVGVWSSFPYTGYSGGARRFTHQMNVLLETSAASSAWLEYSGGAGGMAGPVTLPGAAASFVLVQKLGSR